MTISLVNQRSTAVKLQDFTLRDFITPNFYKYATLNQFSSFHLFQLMRYLKCKLMVLTLDFSIYNSHILECTKKK